ncbi:hypothetical protein EMCRGX_G019932 [Ephydatia muelleri]
MAVVHSEKSSWTNIDALLEGYHPCPTPTQAPTRGTTTAETYIWGTTEREAPAPRPPRARNAEQHLVATRDLHQTTRPLISIAPPRARTTDRLTAGERRKSDPSATTPRRSKKAPREKGQQTASTPIKKYVMRFQDTSRSVWDGPSLVGLAV